MTTPAKNQTKTALVTGASRGIGAAVAVALAQAGSDLAVNYRTNKDSTEKSALPCIFRERVGK